MTTTRLATLLLFAHTSLLPAGTLIFADNFNAPDNTNLDNSDQTGRRSGLLGADVQIRSARIQHGILGSQLNLLRPAAGGSGRVRFQEVASLPTNAWTDFAAGSTGTAILAESGIRVAFDWIPAENTSANWVSFNAGIDSIATAEPSIRVNHAGTDFGILFRSNGGTQYFDNGAATNGSNFDASTLTTHRVEIDLTISSFADFETFTATARVDGTEVLAPGTPFQWENNLGAIFLELGSNNAAGNRLDNFSITTLAGFSLALSSQEFYSSVTSGALIGLLSGTNDGAQEAATFTLVAGAGDADNNKFRINGNRLEANGFDFRPFADATPVSVRVRGQGNTSGNSSEQAYNLLLIADSDADDLPDTWEDSKTDNRANLNGRGVQPGPGPGTGNFDGDSLTDLEEFNLSRTLYPDLSPVLADTDADGLEDGAELNPAGSRLATHPTLADTDLDGLNDFVESNSGSLTGAMDTGTSPVDYDTDKDLFPDGYEIIRGSDPHGGSTPTLPPPLAAVELTTDASSGISLSKTYTHRISGGYGVTVNGVTFDPMTSAIPAPDLNWSASRSETAAAVFSEIAASNLNTWIPAAGGVDENGLLELFGGFTYSSNGDIPGSFQTFTLFGLTPGQNYELHLFIRPWSNVASGRPISLTFTNGGASVNAYVLEDRPGAMLGNGNADSAWYLSFPYTAQGQDITIRAEVPRTTIPISGSWHLYGLTNEAAASTAPDGFAITDVSYQTTPVPAVTLTFASETGATYAVDSSTALNTTGQPGGWTQLVTNLPSGGTQTTFLDTTAAGTGPRIFYRVRRLP